MASDSGQKFIKRNRPPRVQISYEDPGDAEKIVELPFVMGVMADLSGNASPVEKPSMAERKFTDVDMDNLDAYMASIKPAVSMKVDNKLGDEAGNEKLGINLTFSKMADFEPAAVVRQIPALNALLEAREAIGEPAALHGWQGCCRGQAERAFVQSGDDARDERAPGGETGCCRNKYVRRIGQDGLTIPFVS